MPDAPDKPPLFAILWVSAVLIAAAAAGIALLGWLMT
jgi:hypothetical protein